MALYSNLPPQKVPSSSDQTLKVFNNFYSLPVSISNNDLMAMVGFFEARGFDSISAERTAIIILTQAANDGYSAMQILDTLKGTSSVEISGLVTEILNYNRLNTRFLGTSQLSSPSETVLRNVLP
jgi:hypothetical protein